jgi:hypothetical protein
MKFRSIYLKPGRLVQFDFLWKNLLKELQLYDIGEPYWFCTDSLSLILNWLDEVFVRDKQSSILVRIEFFILDIGLL